MPVDNTFELYSSMRGWQKVHTKIDRGVKRICKEMIADIQRGKLIKAAFDDANQKCWKVLEEYVEFGALDSEPVRVCEWKLRKALEAAQYSFHSDYGY